jgi:quinol monooxygenase YgiN
MGRATAKAGCARFSISQDLTSPGAVTVCDVWTTRDDFDAHIRSADYRFLLAVIELSLTPPDISFDDLDHIGGLELIQEIRMSQCSFTEDLT